MKAYDFGPFRLEPAEHRLLRGGQPVSLTPKAFDLLVVLVEHAGHLLKKEELLELLWPGVFVEEVNLAQNVSLIRKTLGGDRETWVQTVAGVGYRFVALEPAAAPQKPVPRLIVLPFRALKLDADLQFLSFSLADALTASLSNLESITVRSSAVAARFTDDPPDLRALARDADVNLVLTGTLLQSSDQLRVTVQLADASAGTVVASHAEHVTFGDLFRLQDSLVERIVESLALPLTTRERGLLRRDVPATAKAYEFFLRGNQISHGARWWTDIATWTLARDLYRACLDEDARFAPAWAALGRVYRVMAKYAPEESGANLSRAEDAFRKALDLNPDLPAAQNLFAQLQIDLGRARDAMVGLLGHARTRRNDPGLFSALCHACRYCGLLDASLAAHERAVDLDSKTMTSVGHTRYVLRDYPDVVEIAERSWGGYGYVGMVALAAIGRENDALKAAPRMEKTAPPNFLSLLVAARTLIEGKRDESIAAMDHAVSVFRDPETTFYGARHFAKHGDAERALAALQRAIDGGYCIYPVLDQDPWFDSVRSDPRFQQIAERLRTVHESMRAAFRDAGGQQILDVPV